METFACEFKVEGLPKTVTSGQMINATVTVLSAEAPVKSVVVSVPIGGIYERMKKQSDNLFVLRMSVPYGGEGMSAQVSVYAVSEDNRRSEAQKFNVTVGGQRSGW